MRITVALEGNPNVGKSTLFNALTGMRQHVGNWPGKTVEKKEGVCKYKGKILEIVDLPGTYSLTAYSIEEMIARDFVIHERPDVVVDIVDASNLERNLYLALQILELTDKVVIALNMMDVAEAKGLEIDIQRLSEILGVPVIPTVADKRRGIDDLLSAVVGVAEGKIKRRPYKLDFGRHLERQIEEIEGMLKDVDLGEHPSRWFAIKLLENDSEVIQIAKDLKYGQRILEKIDAIRKSEIHHEIEVEIVDKRYEIVDKIVKDVLRKRRVPREDITDKIDRVVTHKVFGLPILLGIFAGIFWITFNVSAPLMDAFEGFFGWLGEVTGVWMTSFNAPGWLVSLIVDGVIAGVGGVMVFLPLIAVFFLIFAFLEDWGYMARAAFVMDRIMHAIGLHGRTFLCLLMGYGCNIPGIMATRTLEHRKDRLIAMLINPLIPCGARLGVMTFLVAIFFGGNMAMMVMLSLIVLNLALVVLMGLLLRRFVLPGEHPAFIMELPPYHKPTIRGLAIHTWERAGVFVRRAGTIIVLVSIVIWALSSFPIGAKLSSTYAGQLGKLFEPLGSLMGFDWRVMVALIFGFAAKEMTIATLGVLYGFEEEAALATALVRSWTPLIAYTFLVVQMIYVPCLPCVAVLKRETNSWRWTIFGVGSTLLLALAVGMAIHTLGLCLGLT